MSLDTRAKGHTETAAPHPGHTPPASVRARARDLVLGIRFAVGGGRAGWARTILTAVGVGLGVALLLGAASVPNLLQHRDDRSVARSDAGQFDGKDRRRSDSSVLVRGADTDFRDSTVAGRVLRAEGKHPVLPPGLDKIPADGEMVVSPALRDLLDSPEGKLLKERFGAYRVTGTIGDPGLVHPKELYFYTGSDALTQAKGGHRVAKFGYKQPPEPLDPVLVVLVVLGCVVLLTPVIIFIGTAVRFGGDRRDKRLAALRLVGADARAVRRIAAGESLCGALLGLVLGGLAFLALRELLGVFDVWKLSAFASDVTPVPGLAVLVLLAVPLTAVVVTLISLRAVSIEPLGVFRNAKPRKRRIWWRVLMPVVGIGILLSSGRLAGDLTPPVYAIGLGATLTLIGLAALLPWLVEAAVARLRGGPVPWQLAIRRLQLSSGTAARAVSGITVAVAGAIALQMMFGAMHDDFNRVTDNDPGRAKLQVLADVGDGELAEQMIDKFRTTKGVENVIGTVVSYVVKPGKLKNADDIRPTTELTVGTCANLRELARIDSCEDGDTFVVHTGDADMNDWVDEAARPGKPVDLNSVSWDEPGHRHMPWTLPADSPTVKARPDPRGDMHDGIFATYGAISPSKLVDASTNAMIQVDPDVRDNEEYVRNAAARIDPFLDVMTLRAVERDKQYASIQTGLQIGAMATMVLIAASMLVSMLEQLRERRRLLAALTAFGTRRGSMAWSVLWQTAIPVALGLALAVAGGLGLGFVMVRMIEKSVADWWIFLPLTSAGAVLVAVVTLLSLPPLWRMMRPDGLRTE
ncbi:membrane protein [Streptomyces longisporoflavus]|uniref:FtsX-like permease family protein n=1 Tax=Streptomyces longisporoflavus TaxID=28044 RepID=UPI0019A16154|nr:FtsX-like permease family protein [Streptomyces longisporoflavus]GGV69612.1 membrane protein [Streptomyces longisporoflavus]